MNAFCDVVALALVHPAVVLADRHAPARQRLVELLDLLDGRAVDDARSRQLLQQRDQRLHLLVFVGEDDHFVVEVRTIERRRDDRRASRSRAGTGCRRGRAAARSPSSRAPAGGRRPRAPCAATGTPGRKSWPHCETQCASSTTNRDTPTPPHASRRNTRNSGSAMRSGVVSRSLPPGDAHQRVDLAALLDGQRRVDLRRRDALRDHLVELILDQRDQRADHDGHARHDHRRQLIEQRLAAAGRHHREQILAVEQVLERLGLAGPERLDAERLLADAEQRADLLREPGAFGRDRTVRACTRAAGRRRRRRAASCRGLRSACAAAFARRVRLRLCATSSAALLAQLGFRLRAAGLGFRLSAFFGLLRGGSDAWSWTSA